MLLFSGVLTAFRKGTILKLQYALRMTKASNPNMLYREIQHFRQVWLWVLLLSVSLLAVYGLVQQLIPGIPFGNNPAPDTVLIIIVVVFGFGFPASSNTGRDYLPWSVAAGCGLMG